MSKIVTIRVETEADVKALQKTNKVLKVTEEQAKSTRRQAKEVGKSLDKAGAEGKTGARGILELSRAFEDLQYGIRGILNNIPVTIQAFGGTAKMAGTLSFVAVGLDLAIRTLTSSFENMFKSVEDGSKKLVDEFNDMGEASKEAIDDAIDSGDDLVESIHRSTAAGHAQVQQVNDLTQATHDLAIARANANEDLDGVEKATAVNQEILSKFDSATGSALDEQIVKYEGLSDAIEAAKESRDKLAAQESKDLAAHDAIEAQIKRDKEVVERFGAIKRKATIEAASQGAEARSTEYADKLRALGPSYEYAKGRLEKTIRQDEESGKRPLDILRETSEASRKKREEASKELKIQKDAQTDLAKEISNQRKVAAKARETLEVKGAERVTKAVEARDKAAAKVAEAERKKEKAQQESIARAAAKIARDERSDREDEVSEQRRFTRDVDNYLEREAEKDAEAEETAAKSLDGSRLAGRRIASSVEGSKSLPQSVRETVGIIGTRLNDEVNTNDELIDLNKELIKIMRGTERNNSFEIKKLRIEIDQYREQVKNNR